jgi:hypothetical protein
MWSTLRCLWSLGGCVFGVLDQAHVEGRVAGDTISSGLRTLEGTICFRA